ncbi:MBL fold metallo-hydrolase [Hippea alviniae]|uniref:MBL fold metallo-hydrolase n=1 Tax=Hippea alviniae TaxID=1279027 RepID=UPI0003B46A6D|nr:MBL fold metallo-hydrolase [Hippea alviniae]
MIVKLVVGELQTNCYLFFDDETKETIIIDPGDEPEHIADELDKYGLIPIMVVNTHYHFDHVGGNAFLKERYDVPIAIGELDADFLENSHRDAFSLLGKRQDPSPDADILLSEDRSIKVGRFIFEVIETPGHTPGSISLYQAEEGVLFSGDTLFYESVGRWDLVGGNEFDLLRSVNRLLKLPKETVVYPGHGRETTIEHERSSNPFIEFAVK